MLKIKTKSPKYIIYYVSIGLFWVLILFYYNNIYCQNNESLFNLYSICQKLNIENKTDSLEFTSQKGYNLSVNLNDTFYQYKFLYYYAIAKRPKLQSNIVYYLEKSRNLAFLSKNYEDAFKLDLVIGPEYRTKGKIDSAQIIYNRALIFAKNEYHKTPTTKNAINLLKIQNNIASLMSYIGKEIESINYHKDNLEILKIYPNQYEKFVNLFNISSSYLSISHQENTINNHLNSKRYLKLSKEYFEESELSMPQNLSYLDKASFNYNYSSLFYENKEYKKAKEKLIIAKEYYEKANYKDKLCKCFNLLGEIEIGQKKINEAIINFEKAIEMGTSNTNVSCVASANINLGNAYIKNKQYIKGIAILENNFDYINSFKLTKKSQFNYFNLYLAYKNIGKTELALKNYEKYVQVKDSFYSYQMYSEIDKLEIIYSVNELKDDVQNLTLKNDILEKERELIKSRHLIQLLVIALIVITLITLLGFFYYLSEHKKNKALKEKDNMEHLLLRARLNPHFIFNSLNSIQSQFLSGNHNDANKFLTDFSAFMREILKKTDKPTQTIQQEIAITEMYLKLEQQKYPNRFEYSITLDKQIDYEIAIMPTFILQPIVENSIFHGILNNENKGEIKIEFKLIENQKMLLIQISDNGVGILENQSILKEKSYAIEILKKRLGKDSNYTLNNIVNQENKITGTITQFKIPYYS